MQAVRKLDRLPQPHPGHLSTAARHVNQVSVRFGQMARSAPRAGGHRKSSVECRLDFLLSVRVLSRLFRRMLLDKLTVAHKAGQLEFFGKHARLADPKAFAAYLAPLRKREWVVYSKRPFGGPEEVLRYLARYTHRVAISNRRLIACDEKGVTFKWKDYRIEGAERYKTMTLATHEFIRRFLMHVLPAGFHRIRYYGMLNSSKRGERRARPRTARAGTNNSH